MRTLFLRVLIGLCTRCFCRINQNIPPRLKRRAPALPSEMKIAGVRPESSILHLLKRYLFMRDCKRKRAVSALRYTLF